MKLTANPAWLSLPPNRGKGSGAKFLRIMKLTTIIILAACLHTSAKGVAQQTITFSGKEVSLESVFTAIKKQTNYRFFFNTDMLATASKVTLDVKNAQIEQVMNMALKDQPLTFTIKGRTIFVMRKKDGSKSSSGWQKQPPIDVKGRVLNENGDPLESVSVNVKGTTITVTTNSNGDFFIKGIEEDAILIFTSVNMETFELNVSGRKFLDVALQTKISAMQEVVINKGYYSEKRKFLTGNVGRVSSRDIEIQPVNNVLLALQGRVPGLTITQNSGVPGGNVKVQIRGQNSITQNTTPLYIIDGVPYGGTPALTVAGLSNFILQGGGSINPFNFINPSDILNVEVLKDADATAIYGSRGSNGVILITTKKGQSGVLKADVNIQSGFGQITRKADLLNTEEYLQMRKEAFVNDNVVPSNSNAPDLLQWDQTSYTDWQDVIMGGRSKYNDAQINVSGGSANTQYRIGGGYHKETTVFPGDWYDQKVSFQFSTQTSSANKRLKILLSGNYMSDNNRLPAIDLTSRIILAPNAPSPIYEDNSLNWTDYSSNPLNIILYRYQAKNSCLVGNSTISYAIIPGLDIKANLGYTKIETNEKTALPITYNNPALNIKTGSASFNDYKTSSWIAEPQISYKKNFGKDNLNMLIGATLQQRSTEGQRIDASGYPNDALLGSMAAALALTKGNTIYEEYKYSSMFARLNYVRSEKYILNLTTRRDGSSRFGPGKQFGNFGAVGIGWIFSNEPLFKKFLPILSFGKIRMSYGTTGNEPGDNYRFMELYNYTTNNAYQGGIGVYPNNIKGNNFSWEVIKKFEVGGELSFIKDRISLNLSYFDNRSSNQLVSYNLPSITGFFSTIANLPAVVQNSGIEMSLNTMNIKAKKIVWYSNFNISIIKNKLLEFPNIETSPYNNTYIIGQPLTIVKVLKFADVDPNSGVYRFYDSKGDFISNPSYPTDYISQVNLSPKFYGGLQNTFQYKGIQLDLFFQFTKQIGRNYLFAGNFAPGQFSASTGGNQPSDVFNRWQNTGDESKYQKFTRGGNGVTAYSDYAKNSTIAYSDASYIRLKNVALSYQLPDPFRKKIHADNIRFYIQGQNILTITKYKGVDPENQSVTILPPLRVITFGVQLTL